MKQEFIFLILLLVYTVQNKIHTESSKNENSKRGSTRFTSILNKRCEPGYVYECRGVVMNKVTLIPMTKCSCFKEESKEKKVGITPKKDVDLTERAKTEKIKTKTSLASSPSKGIKCPKGYVPVVEPEFDFKTGLHFHFRCKKSSKDKKGGNN